MLVTLISLNTYRASLHEIICLIISTISTALRKECCHCSPLVGKQTQVPVS